MLPAERIRLYNVSSGERGSRMSSLPTLYNLTRNYLEVLCNIPDDASQEAVNDTLDAIEGAIEVKAGNIAAVRANLRGEIAKFKAEEERIAAGRRSMEKAVARLEKYLLLNMESLGMSELSAGTFTVKIQNNPPAVNITDEKSIPAEYTTIKTEIVVDKKRIADALKAGQEIPGAVLAQGRRLVVR